MATSGEINNTTNNEFLFAQLARQGFDVAYELAGRSVSLEKIESVFEPFVDEEHRKTNCVIGLSALALAAYGAYGVAQAFSGIVIPNVVISGTCFFAAREVMFMAHTCYSEQNTNSKGSESLLSSLYYKFSATRIHRLGQIFIKLFSRVPDTTLSQEWEKTQVTSYENGFLDKTHSALTNYPYKKTNKVLTALAIAIAGYGACRLGGVIPVASVVSLIASRELLAFLPNRPVSSMFFEESTIGNEFLFVQLARQGFDAAYELISLEKIESVFKPFVDEEKREANCVIGLSALALAAYGAYGVAQAFSGIVIPNMVIPGACFFAAREVMFMAHTRCSESKGSESLLSSLYYKFSATRIHRSGQIFIKLFSRVPPTTLSQEWKETQVGNSWKISFFDKTCRALTEYPYKKTNKALTALAIAIAGYGVCRLGGAIPIAPVVCLIASRELLAFLPDRPVRSMFLEGSMTLSQLSQSVLKRPVNF